jgi:hypothetical protein
MRKLRRRSKYLKVKWRAGLFKVGLSTTFYPWVSSNTNTHLFHSNPRQTHIRQAKSADTDICGHQIDHSRLHRGRLGYIGQEIDSVERCCAGCPTSRNGGQKEGDSGGRDTPEQCGCCLRAQGIQCTDIPGWCVR